MYIFAYAQPDSDASNFLCETSGARSHLWRCWSPGMAVWAQTDFFSKCSPRISRVWAQTTDSEDLFPMVFCVLDRYWASPCFPVKKENKSAQMSSCAQCRTSHGEQFKQNQRLCPKSPEYSKKQGEQICEMPLLCPNPGKRSQRHHKEGV